MGNILQRQYQKAFSNPGNVSTDVIHLDKRSSETLADIEFAISDVIEAIDETQSMALL